MTADPLSREGALQRTKEAGRKAGLWGSPREANHFARSPSLHEEGAAWEAGRQIGAAEKKRGAK